MSSTRLQASPSVAKHSRGWLVAGGILLAILAFWLGWNSHSPNMAEPAMVPTIAIQPPSAAAAAGMANIYAHNLRLHQGPNFRVYVQWLRGQLTPLRKGVIPSFDDPDSFYLNVTNGIIRANIGDVCNYLNARSSKSPLRDIKMTGTGDQVTITGTLHKLISFPVELKGTLAPSANNRVQIHVDKINLLKIPFKAILGGFHVTLSDFMSSGQIVGVEVKGNDIYFDPYRLLPPPHILGSLTHVSMISPDLEAVYGDVKQDAERVVGWRNFLRLRNGSLSFGKLTMRDVDLMMVDISQDAWFDLDLANYQDQLVNGYTRITAQQGLQIFMPDFSELKNPGGVKDLNMQWLKHRNAAPPHEVTPKK